MACEQYVLLAFSAKDLCQSVLWSSLTWILKEKKKEKKKGHCNDLQTLKTSLGGDEIGLVGAEGRMRIHH